MNQARELRATTDAFFNSGFKRSDSAALASIFVGLSNSSLGYNDPERDVSSTYNVGQVHPFLSYEQETNLHGIGILKRIVDCYPIECGRDWFKLDFGTNKNVPKKIDKYFRNIQQKSHSYLSIQEAFTRAGIQARLHGNGFILLGVSDGRKPSDPIDWQNIQSFDWFFPLRQRDLIPVDYLRGDPCHPEFYDQNLYSPEFQEETGYPFLGKIRWHRDRVVRFRGTYPNADLIELNGGYDIGVLPPIVNPWARSVQCDMASSALLSQSSQLNFYVNDLARAVEQDRQNGTTENQEYYIKRLRVLLKAANAMGIILLDKEEESAEIINRNLNGVGDIYKSLRSSLLANVDVPEYLLFNQEGSQGLTSKEGQGYANRATWCSRKLAWSSSTFLPGFIQIVSIIIKAKDSEIEDVDEWGAEPASEVYLSELEQTEVLERLSRVDKTYDEIGTYSGQEARVRFLGGKPVVNLILPSPSSPSLAAEATPRSRENDLPSSLSSAAEATPRSREDDSTPTCRIIDWHGRKIELQYLPFQKRYGRLLTAGYGRVRGTKSPDDGMAMDVYVGTNLDSPLVFEIDQYVDGKFDEHKYVVGVNSQAEAKAIYLAAMPKEMLHAIRKSSPQVFNRDRA